MTINAAELLKVLGSGVRPVGGPAASPADTTIEHAAFDSLLRRAEAGALESGRSLEPAPNLQGLLSGDQLDRLAHAADAGEAAGASRMVALIDGLLVEIDVTTRTINGIVDASAMEAGGVLSAGSVLSNIDAAVVVPPSTDAASLRSAEMEGGSPEEASLARILPRPTRSAAAWLAGMSGEIENRSVAELLASLGVRSAQERRAV